MTRDDVNKETFMFPVSRWSDAMFHAGEVIEVNLFGKVVHGEIIDVVADGWIVRNLDYVPPPVTTRAYGRVTRELQL